VKVQQFRADDFALTLGDVLLRLFCGAERKMPWAWNVEMLAGVGHARPDVMRQGAQVELPVAAGRRLSSQRLSLATVSCVRLNATPACQAPGIPNS
jgi:hypothetical protein